MSNFSPNETTVSPSRKSLIGSADKVLGKFGGLSRSKGEVKDCSASDQSADSKSHIHEALSSPVGKTTKFEAINALNEIRAAYPDYKGWKEIRGYVEERSDGKWYAVLIHEKVF